MSVKPSLVVFLHSHRYDRLYQAMSLVLTASAMGRPCHLFLFYGALASYMKGSWDDVNVAAGMAQETPSASPEWASEMARGFERSNLPSLYDMLEKARVETGGVRVLACSTSCKVLGLDVTAVRERVDEVVGLPTMMQIAEGAGQALYI